MNRPPKPVPKVTAAALGGAVATLIVTALGAAGVHVDATVGGALATVLGFAAGYLKA